MLLDDVVAGIASVSTIGLFCTGISICTKIVRNGHTRESSFFPLMVMFVQSVLWMKYGMMQADSTLIIVNAVGTVLGLIYSVIYYWYTAHTNSIIHQIIFGAALTFPCLVYVMYYATNHDDAMWYMGYWCVALGVLGYGAPLSAMGEVIRTKNSEVMSLPLCAANCLVALEWYIYGWIRKDWFVQAPNVLGFFLCLLQLALIWKYHRRRTQLHQSAFVTSQVVQS